jgi:hypothetical protein
MVRSGKLVRSSSAAPVQCIGALLGLGEDTD